ncbi:putative Phox domain, sorting nexin Vps5-like, AH/BAR domain superfamily, PX domain superfamily [Helianthus annuus]|uniref:Putative sorting nexin-5/6/32 n=1 Tax=Helianthus annuus TaxID=4232 RepID=A0A251U7W0_HELAN|nr:sorting nexin 2A [Helianthus annuus]KAF5795042.1 putative vacuolar protein sorting-associated protein 17, Vps17 [Helianthus annuus]KAJ0553233.1 putative sorting nexin Vps5-like, AH/BAR domain superfamily, PX domain superfamily [Helianthus annuus]KAJ0722147.1 putative sorting nexin Vps5-like, AH/BAR domain superfamily, PX domain superfamily [Helianthus annuus]KAJ0897511.1 putative Phox domain, sorting nexin Vps5-like, AH/BAR domain superfamily, PX domain superfamily [Helianthus annuus]
MMSYEQQGFEEPQFYSSHESIDFNNPKSPNSTSTPAQFAEILTTEHGDPLTHSSSFHTNPNSFNSLIDSSSSFHTNPTSFNSFIDPPSYAEAVFRSFDGVKSDQINEHDDVSTSEPSVSNYYLHISVRDPRKIHDLAASVDSVNSVVSSGKNYLTYLITTWTNLPEFNGTEFSVRRRFKDVVMLSDRLLKAYRGCFIPTRPDKGVVESQVMQKHEFIEQRRVALEKYFKKLAAHPVIRHSEDLRVFLQVQGDLKWMNVGNVGAVVESREVGNQGKGGRDVVRMFKELRQSVTYGWGGTKPPLVEEDKEFLEKKMKLQDFELQLSNVSLQAESLVKAQQDIGETMGQLGLVFVKLTKFETEEAVFISQKTRAKDMKNMATSSVKASRLYGELNAQTIKHLDKLHDYLGVMLDVNNAYSDRSNALLTVQTVVTEISILSSRIEKLEAAAFKIFGADRSRIQKIDELKETLRVTEDAKNHAVKEYKRIKETNKTEFERLDKEKREDFIGMLKGFVVNQAGYAEKMASVWETFAKETNGYAGSCS